MQSLLIQKKGKLIYLTLNRPKVRNALNQELIINLTKTLKKIQQDKTIHAVILKGSNHFFCAGADLTEMKDSLHYTSKQNFKQAKFLADLLHIVYNLNKPTVAIIEGGAYGGGLGLVAACDIAISDIHTKFCFSEAKLGLIPAMISPYIIKAIGEKNAKRYFLTAEVFNAETAKQLGLIQAVANENELDPLSDKILKALSENSLNAMTKIKKLFNPIKTAIQKKLIKSLADIRTTKDAQTRLSVFLDK